MSAYKNCVFPLYRTYANQDDVLVGSCFRLFNDQTYVTCAHCLRDGQGNSIPATQLLIGENKFASRDEGYASSSQLPARRSGKVKSYVFHPDGQDIAIIQTNHVTGFHGGMQLDYFTGIAPTCSSAHASPIGVDFDGYFCFKNKNNDVVLQSRKGSIVDSDNVSQDEYPVIHTDLTIIQTNSGGPVVFNETGTGRVAAMLSWIESVSQYGEPARLDTSEAILLHPFEAWIRDHLG